MQLSLFPRNDQTQHFAHNIVTEPTAEPITRSELRTFLRNPPTEDNEFLDDCLVQARVLFEAYTGVACITQVWKLTLDYWPQLQVELPRYPLASVDSVTTYDSSGSYTAQTIATLFYVDTQSKPGRLRLKNDQAWPTASQNTNAIEIQYTAGYGSAATDVPLTLRRALLTLAGYLYMHRGACSEADAFHKSGVLQIAAPYVKVRM